MGGQTPGGGLGPGSVRALLRALRRLTLPACLPLSIALVALGVALSCAGWWSVLPAVLPGDEMYGFERVAGWTVRSLLGMQQQPDAPEPPALSAIGLAVSAAGLLVIALGGVLRAATPLLHARLARSARDLCVVLADDETGIGLGDPTSSRTTLSLTAAGAPLPREQLTLRLGSTLLERTLPRCADRVRELLALHRDPDPNLGLTRRLIEWRRGDAPALERVRLRVDSRAQRQSIGRTEFDELTVAAHDLALVSLPAARARRLLREQPPNKVRTFELGGRAALVIVGLGDTGIELLARACAQGQSPALDPLVIAIVDSDAVTLARDLAAACPALALAVELVPIPLEAALPQAAGALLERLTTQGLIPTCIYLALGERALADAWDRELQLATRASGRPSSLVLTVRYPQPTGRSLLEEEESLDVLPRELHAGYLRASNGSDAVADAVAVEWSRLPFDYQEDNRSAADHFWTKARDLDVRIVPGVAGLTTLAASPTIDSLASAEHRRWVASRALAGWRHGAMRSEPERLHPRLVPWEMLPQEERAKDRAVLLDMPRTLSAARLALQPLRSLHIPAAGCTHPQLLSAVEVACAAASCAQPAALAHFLVVVESGAGFTAAQRIAARPDAAVSLILTQPLEALAIAAGQPARAAAALREASQGIWLTSTGSLERLLARWPALPGIP